MQELWRFCRDGKTCEYYVSNHGRIKSVQRSTGKEHIRTLACNTNGYLHIKIPEYYGKKTYQVHRLVAEAFVEPYSGDVVNHLDFDKTNARADNLEWCTQRENVRYNFKPRVFA